MEFVLPDHGSLCYQHTVESTEKAEKSACIRLVLRIPDYRTCSESNEIPATSRHTQACFSIPDVHTGMTFYMNKLYCLLYKVKMPVNVIRMLKSIAEHGRWYVLEYVPSEYIRIAVLLYWSSITTQSDIIFSTIRRLGPSIASFVSPFHRFHVPLDFLTLQRMLASHEPRNCYSDELLNMIEDNHKGVVPAVKAFIETGDEVAYAAAYCNPFAKPTVQSLQRAIDVGRYIRVQLKPYQIATIAWALDKEQYGDISDVYQIRPSAEPSDTVIDFYHNYQTWVSEVITKKNSSSTLRGGFIFDEMGMGKTLQMLGLIIAADYMKAAVQLCEEEEDDSGHVDREELDLGLGVETPSPVAVSTTPSTETKTNIFHYNGDKKPYVEGGTLVVVPLALLNQWVHEIEHNIVNGDRLLRPVVYHGSSRHGMELHHSPIVLTTYETLGADIRYYRNHDKLAEAYSKTSWKCPNVLYIKPYKDCNKHVLEVNDVVTLSGMQRQIVKITNEHVYLVHMDHVIKKSKIATFTNTDGIIRYQIEAVVNSMIVNGSLQECNARHENALQIVCPVCSYNIHHDISIDEYLSTVLTSPVETVTWQRIVLDESHKIQSTVTSQFDAIRRLRTQRKWCMTGTPMPKNIDNLQGQLEFMGISRGRRFPPAKAAWYADIMSRHLKRDCLCDEDGKIELPPITYRDVHVTLGPTDLALYTALRNATLARYASRTEEDKMFVPLMFQLIARERRACTVICDTVKLKRGRRPKVHVEVAPELPPIPPNALNPKDDCPVCFEPIPHPVMLACRHCFCNECLLALLEAGEHKCPLCQLELNGQAVLEAQRTCRAVADALSYIAPAPQAAAPADDGVIANEAIAYSAPEKFQVLLDLVKGPQARPTLVYTQFDDAVYTLQVLLQQQEVPVQILTGSMTRAARSASIQRFREQSNGVLILSLRTAAVGLNLIHASLVVFMDPPMNTGLEMQACGRVHRLGQKNPVEIVHIIARGTVEERIRRFRDIDMTDTDEVQVGKVKVVLTETQKRHWRETQLCNLMGR